MSATRTTQRRVRAVYMRGGTSRCLVFHERGPAAGGARARPHPARRARQPRSVRTPARRPRRRHLVALQGVHHRRRRPTPDADVDYTFAQVEVGRPVVDYTGNCGNCSSSVGPFAIDEGLVPARPTARPSVRIHNTNTKKIIVAHVPVTGGEAAVAGDFELPGVAGRGARIALDFVDPGGARTGKLLPTGPRDRHRGRAQRLARRRHQPDGLRARQGPRPHRHRVAAGDGRRPRPRRTRLETHPRRGRRR